MLDQRALRRTDYREGTGIRLADGQQWIFPPPPSAEEAAGDPNYVPLLGAVLDAEDRADLLRTELILAIHLLARNYNLGAKEFRSLLAFPPGSPSLAASQEAFHELATQHLEALRAREEVAPAAARPPGWLARARMRLVALLGIRRAPEPPRSGSIQLDG
jgi:hypothetical protein